MRPASVSMTGRCWENMYRLAGMGIGWVTWMGSSLVYCAKQGIARDILGASKKDRQI
jgi:hypothetical protein